MHAMDIERKIGFDAIRSEVSGMCVSALGRDCCANMTFVTSAVPLRTRLMETAEMLAIICSEQSFPAEAIHDRRAMLSTLRVPGSFPPESELVGLRASLGAMSSIKRFFEQQRSDDSKKTPYPYLDSIAYDMPVFPHIYSAIDRIIDRNGDIKDNASPELAEIRRAMSVAATAIHTAMRRVMATAINEGYIDSDTTPTMRDGRLVLPVAPMYKRKIAGIVQGESGSGKTYFIEPAQVVEANNRLRELAADERREIVRILMSLADTIRPEVDSMLEGFSVLGKFDFIYAKARYARSIDASMPVFSDTPELEWYHACHPLLRRSLERQGKEIVPLDIHLTSERRLLVISGPNAGGKSVTLKTVALIQYMFQCGLLPPVYTNSHMGVFGHIFIDIGDDQSIEDDLSTYSSHLRNMKRFMSEGDSSSLVLIDEFGGGTEPQIGGAIAQAVLRRLNDNGMWGVITTHYQNLKQFAEDTSGLVNGSMLYDRGRMQPTFRLAIGHPGSSFAIEIARRIGLPEDIIEDAREIVGSDYVNMDKYLLDIARDRKYWEHKRDTIRAKEKHLEQTLARYEEEVETLRQKRREIIGEARTEAQRILDGSNATIERTIRDIRNAQADKELTRQARERLDEERRALHADSDDKHPLLTRKIPRKKKESKETPTPEVEKKPFVVGDNVVMSDGASAVGTIAEINGREAVVVFGQIKTRVKIAQLRHTMRSASSGATRSALVQDAGYISAQTSEASRERQLAFSQQLDVRGMRADEAVQAVMYYIDDAIQFNSSRVRILHGTGTGALRQVIRQYLGTIPAITSYHDEDVRMGGSGITVVEF